MKASIYIFLILGSLFSCNKKSNPGEPPVCLQERIIDFNNNLSCDDAQIEEYTFQGKSVFVFSAGTCGADMASPVMDSNCQSLGSLGGFTGNTKINGEEFSNAVFVKVIWKK